MIRKIDYSMEYCWLTWVNDSDDEVLDRKFELLTCEESLKELSADLVAVAKDTAKEQLTPAKLQVVNSFLWILYISPRNILLVMSDIIPMQLTVFKLFISCRQRICPVKWKGYSSLAHKWPNLFYLPYWEYLPSY